MSMRASASPATSTARFEARFVAAASLVLGALGAAVAALLPFVADVAAADLAATLAAVAGSVVAYALARSGRTAAAGLLLLTVLVALLGVALLRSEASPSHELLLLALVVPVFLAFTLRHYAAGAVLAGASAAYAGAHSVASHTVEQAVTAVAVLLGLSALAGLAAALRDREQERADAAERQRHAAHTLYASLVDQAAEGIFRTTRAGAILFANPALVRMLGYADLAQFQAEVQTARDVYFDPEDRPRLLEWVSRQPGKPFEVRWRRRDGSPIWVALRPCFVLAPDGESLQGTVEDLTAARVAGEAQERIRQSERLLRDAQAMVHLGSWMHDLATDRDTWSEETYRIFGLPPGSEVASRDIFARIHPEDRSRVRASFETAVATAGPFDSEHRLLLPDGQVKHVLAKARTERDASGRVHRIVGAILDVTEMRTARERLREAEDQNRRLLEESPLAVVRVAPDGRFLAANPAAVRIYRVPDVATLCRLNARDFYPDPGQRPARVADAAAQPGQFSRELQLRRPDGSLFWVRSHSRAVRDGAGAVRHFEAIIEDITDQKAGEEARRELDAKQREVRRLEELNRMRMDFLNTAAHDLRTPLTPLRLQMATLRRQQSSPGQKEALDLMDRNLLRVQALVEDMLDAARLQAGTLRLKRSPVELAPLVEETVASFAEVARAGGLQVEVSAPPGIVIDADANKCMQVLMNLVSNAVKYTAPGGHVRVRAAADATTAEVSVQDDGLGMAPEQVARLFQPFVRLHEAVPGAAKGTGLGLYISKGIAESHGGRLWAESDGPGRGTTFRLAWPLAKTVQAATQADLAEPAAVAS